VGRGADEDSVDIDNEKDDGDDDLLEGNMDIPVEELKGDNEAKGSKRHLKQADQYEHMMKMR
jgi:uncharacterized protein with LGFP repeats